MTYKTNYIRTYTSIFSPLHHCSYFSDPIACGYTHARARFTQVKLYNLEFWSVSSLLHAALSCTLVRLNSRGILDIRTPYEQTRHERTFS